MIGIGSNILPQTNLPESVQALGRETEILSVSKVYRTPPQGGQGPDFLNAAVHIKTARAMEDLREQVLRKIESRLGRRRSGDPNAPRTIDLDILIFDGIVLDQSIWDLAHLCVPISDLLPIFPDPSLNDELLKRSSELRKSTLIEAIPLELHRS